MSSRTRFTAPTVRRLRPARLPSFSNPTKCFKSDAALARLHGIEVKPNIKDLSFKELIDFLLERKHPAYRARQVWQWLFQKRAISFGEMTNLARSLRDELEQVFLHRPAADSAQGRSARRHGQVSVRSQRWRKHRERSDSGNPSFDLVHFHPGRLRPGLCLLRHRGVGP